MCVAEVLRENETCIMCKQCRLPFSSAGELQLHVSENHRESLGNRGKCNLCGKYFPKLADLDRHTLLEHARENTPVTPAIPPRRSETVGKKSVFDKMEFVDDPGTDRKYRCKICGSSFKLRHHCSDHIKAIHQQLSYPCEVCNKRYKSKRALKMHLLDHQDQGVVTNVEAYHRCQICKKAFLRRHQFENHVRVRHGTMMFPCHLCDKRFTHEELLHSHMKNHKETYKFKCQICQISFATVKDRQVHTAVHTGDIKVELADMDSTRQDDSAESAPGVPVICSVCGLTFINDDALKVHCIKDHNDPVILCCNSCSSEHASFLDLLNHIKENHKHQSDPLFNPALSHTPQNIDDMHVDSATGGSRDAGVIRKDLRNLGVLQDSANGDDSEGGSNEDEEDMDSAEFFTKANDETTPVPASWNKKATSGREKKYKCHDCGHKFGYLHHLRDHRNSYHKGVIYSCKRCGKQYKRRNSLREHTCEQLACQLCMRPFQYKGHLIKHLQQIHHVDPSNNLLGEEEENSGDIQEGNTIHLELLQDGEEANEAEAAAEQEDIKPIVLSSFMLE